MKISGKILIFSLIIFTFLFIFLYNSIGSTKGDTEKPEKTVTPSVSPVPTVKTEESKTPFNPVPSKNTNIPKTLVKINNPGIAEAIAKGDIKKVKEMLEKDPSLASGIVNYSGEFYGYTLLRLTARYNNKEMAELLIKYGAPVNEINNSYTTSLHTAAEYNSKDVAELLIKNGADVNAQGDISQTPLHTAAYHNSKEVAELLIKNGANLNAGDYFCGCHSSGNSPLHYAVWGNSIDVAELLIDSGADINNRNYGEDQDDTPLYTAVKYDKKEIFDLLIKKARTVVIFPYTMLSMKVILKK